MEDDQNGRQPKWKTTKMELTVPSQAVNKKKMPPPGLLGTEGLKYDNKLRKVSGKTIERKKGHIPFERDKYQNIRSMFERWGNELQVDNTKEVGRVRMK